MMSLIPGISHHNFKKTMSHITGPCGYSHLAEMLREEVGHERDVLLCHLREFKCTTRHKRSGSVFNVVDGEQIGSHLVELRGNVLLTHPQHRCREIRTTQPHACECTPRLKAIEEMQRARIQIEGSYMQNIFMLRSVQ